ncbi:MAG: ECF transporter S component [Candidatus Bathyarchaeia archaeon]
MNEQIKSLKIVAMIMCAALYAIGAYATAYIPSPWGFGQFRPAVAIPAFFAVLFGPLPAGIGAAIGTLIADSVKHGTLHLGSLIAAVPGNFIGFYIFGRICRGFTWKKFIVATNVTLTSANLLTAFLYIYVYRFLYLQALKIGFSEILILTFGLTVWWFVTMLPFVLTITPLLIRVVSMSMPSIVPEGVRSRSLNDDLPKTGFGLSLLIPGIILLMLGLITTFTDLGKTIVAVNRLLGMEPLQILLYGSGATLTPLGLYSIIRANRKPSNTNNLEQR